MNRKQVKYLQRAEKSLGVGPVEMAARLETSWNTYKAWKAGRNPIPGAAKVAIEALIRLKNLE